jgi:hypothetical protein
MLGHVIVFASDLAASVAFYRDVVGFEHRFTDAGYAEFATGATRFALYEQRRAWLFAQTYSVVSRCVSGDASPCNSAASSLLILPRCAPDLGPSVRDGGQEKV